jgi:uncharacterized protein YjbI with pentapeptide repeats
VTVTNLTGAKFDDTDMSQANFTQVNAQGVFINGLAVGANFTNANLRNADLSKATSPMLPLSAQTSTGAIAVDAIGLTLGTSVMIPITEQQAKTTSSALRQRYAQW